MKLRDDLERLKKIRFEQILLNFLLVTPGY
jgi:hypothetical protein